MKIKMKNLLRYFLWLVGLRKYLPKIFIDKIIILENNEPLVKMQETDKLIFFTKNNLTPFLRKTVINKLHYASNLLPNGYKLVLVEAYRSLENQEEKWGKMVSSIKKSNPELNDDEIFRRARLFIAEPTGKGPHQTGGAIDVTLSLKEEELDMGTKWCEFSKKTETFSKEITKIHQNNRKILLKIMEKAGFVNYPGEWWHFSYGDKMWAAYSRKKSCIYGSVQLKNTR